MMMVPYLRGPAGSRAAGTPHAVGDRVLGARGAGAPSAAACGAPARGTCRAARRFEASSQLSTHHPRLATLNSPPLEVA